MHHGQAPTCALLASHSFFLALSPLWAGQWKSQGTQHSPYRECSADLNLGANITAWLLPQSPLPTAVPTATTGKWNMLIHIAKVRA